ncbi:SpaH/EbpB family LPXTG-anchored major pilin [Microbacterium sp. F2E]|uniref:SpaH/EbpB family LPXTG-anchored major pilin n=1 Tax=Microbacterium sp. F2E TaxID=2895284 RepID=UPI001E408DC7|nr:SpaH/EbpB family LPXTG-anchored major pilin [Microbacterium sp. F2E]MCC9054604.1 SpaH/EbpB family LPXTG-anchored major pilin [Microbacterium sp. F2E]
MTIKSTAVRRVIAGAGAFALAVTGVLASGMAASAVVGPGPDQPGAPESGSLTINKYKGQPTANPAVDDLLSGVQFIVTQVGRTVDGTCEPLDLTEISEWDGIEALFPAAAGAPASAPSDPFCLTSNVYDETTDGNGQIVLDDLPLSLYFVQEGTDNGDNSIVSKVPDFYVSVPTSLDAAAGWEYDVVVNPKNAVLNQPSKAIDEDQQDLVVGSDVTWTLDVPIPVLNNDETFTEAVVTDVLDSRLSYSGTTSVEIAGTPTTDFVYDAAAGTWTFGATARAALDAAAEGSSITIVFTTTVNAVGDGSIPNDDYSSTFNGTTIPGEVVPFTYWGQLSIQKNDNSTPVRALEGAEFQVFDAADEGVCPAEAPASGEIATGVSDASGVVQWAGVTPTNVLGLWVANTQTEDASVSKVYCVYETVVPAGHTAVPFAPEVTITPGAPVTGESALTVVNDKQQGPNLPLTGGTGSWALAIGGLLLVGGGVASLVIARHRREKVVD